MFGLKYVGSFGGGARGALTRKFLVGSGTTITKGDCVSLSSGYLIVATSGTKIVGVANATVVGAATNLTSCEVIVDPYALYLITNDNVGTTFSQAYVGYYFMLTGTTGAQLMDTSTDSTTTGQLVAVQYNPQGYEGGIYDATTSIALVMVAGSFVAGATLN
jgi:hypothetical protein